MLSRYRDLVTRGIIAADPAQEAAAVALEAVRQRAEAWRPVRRRLFALFAGASRVAPQGLYLYGGVGRGKTMLMDLFFAAARIKAKRRVHFHQFMADVHERIAARRKVESGDPIAAVAKALIAETDLLCLDELHVTDIADAMIVGRLFTALFDEGIVLVSTSNAHPEDLYRSGLNRQLFLPFVDLLQTHVVVHEVKSARDFRLDKLAGESMYFAPADASADAAMDRIWLRLTGEPSGAPASLEVKGRRIDVPKSAMGVARFTFADLCDRPLGTLDYQQIASSFHTVMIDRIPRLTADRRNEARRFINLIDTLYDKHIGLIASADCAPDELYAAGDGADHFTRTASRLVEMQSAAYLGARGKPKVDRTPGAR